MTDLALHRLARARRSLEGLALGDATGRALVEIGAGKPAFRQPPWKYTDDTEMAIAIVTTLAAHGYIDQDALAYEFAKRFSAAPARGYGALAYWMLTRISEGQPWRKISREPYDGQGSQGNGAAMRVAPLGAYYADDLDQVVLEAEASAVVTHAHPEGRAGAIAVAVAAALAATSVQSAAGGASILAEVLRRTPRSTTRAGLELAASLHGASPREAARRLGTGTKILASDTVPLVPPARSLVMFTDPRAELGRTRSGRGVWGVAPTKRASFAPAQPPAQRGQKFGQPWPNFWSAELAIWCAVSHLHDLRAALVAAIEAFDTPDSDADTICAIVGGIVASSASEETFPHSWVEHREPLPAESARSS